MSMRLVVGSVLLASGCGAKAQSGSKPRPPLAEHTLQKQTEQSVARAQESGIETRVNEQMQALSFLDGCWHHWSVDWGFDLCWSLDATGWVGEFQSSGGMGPRSRLTLHIAQGPKTLKATAKGNLAGWFEAGFNDVEMTLEEKNHVRFGVGESVLEFKYLPVSHELHFRPWSTGPHYQLRSESLPD